MGYLDKKIPEFPDSSQIISMSLRRCRHSISECYSLLNKAQPLYLWASFDKTSYVKMVGLGGLEPPTSPLSGVRSNQAELQTRLLRTGILAFISSGIKTIKKRVFYTDE